MSQLVRERMETSSIGEDSTRPVNFTALATQTEGYSVTDLKDLVARAVHQAAIRPSEMGDTDEIRVCSIQFGKPAANALVQTTLLLPEDFATAQVDFVPHSLRDVKLQRSEVEWADIGGKGQGLVFAQLAKACWHCRSQRNQEGPSGDSRMAHEVWTHLRSVAASIALRVSFHYIHVEPQELRDLPPDFCCMDIRAAERLCSRQRLLRSVGSTSSALRVPNC